MPLTSSIDDLFNQASQQSTSAADADDQAIYTGRYIAYFKDDATDAGIAAFQTTYNVPVANAASFDGQQVDFSDLGAAEVLIFPQVGAALVSAEAYASISSAGSTLVAEAGDPPVTGAAAAPQLPADSPIAFFEAEIFVFAIDDPTTSDTSSDATNSTSSTMTPGLVATGVAACTFSGQGIKVCVLDTGLDLSHPDFAGRSIVSSSFVAGQTVQDGNSHGTHTAGTACGPLAPASGGPRYGVAYNASLYIGKVLSDAGRGTTATSIAGINWALANGCEVISMSLEAKTGVQAGYTLIGTRALANNSIIIAAAGNESQRPGTIAATGAPANSPSILSVAALDDSQNIATFSNGGKVEIAGPGVDVYSSVPQPALHGNKSGTSMATPHVSGIAALWAEALGRRGQALWADVVNSAKPAGAASDVGAGFVHAPSPTMTSTP
jgi:subtilisin